MIQALFSERGSEVQKENLSIRLLKLLDPKTDYQRKPEAFKMTLFSLSRTEAASYRPVEGGA